MSNGNGKMPGRATRTGSSRVTKRGESGVSKRSEPKDSKRADSLWLRGRVPSGYWDRVENRRAYMKWLGKTLGFRKPADWYNISKQDFHCNYGGGLIANYYRDSPQQAVLDYLPDHPWRGWLFRSTPQGFWQSKQNRMDYMDWLGETLGLKSLDDWYHVSRSHFHTHRGGGMLANYYGDSVFRALKEYAPRKKWLPWGFQTVPQGFWQDQKNRQAYMRWMGQQCGFERVGDWYQLNRQHFIDHRGEALFATYYKGSILKALEDFKPAYKWSKTKLKASRR